MRLVFNGLRFINSRASGHRHRAQRRRSPSTPATSCRACSCRPRSRSSGPTIEADIAREGGMLRRVFASSDANSQGEGAGPADRAAPGRTQLQFADRPARHDPDRAAPRSRCATSRPGSPGSPRRRGPALKRDAAGVNISAQARLTGDAGNCVDVSLSGVYTRDRSRISLSMPASTASSPRCWPTCRPTPRCCAASTSRCPAGCTSRRTARATCAASSIDVTGGNGG